MTNGGFFMSKEFKWGSFIAAIALSLWTIFGEIFVYFDVSLIATQDYNPAMRFFDLFSEGIFTAFLIIVLVLISVGMTLTNILVDGSKNKWLFPLTAFLFLVAAILYFYVPSIFSFETGANEDMIFQGSPLVVNGFFLIVLAFIYLRHIFTTVNVTVKDIAEMASLVGLALVLDLAIFKLKVVPNGGSISLAMFPLFVLALRKGPLKGVIACGIVYGFINCLIDGYGLITYPLDYLLGFGSIALAGFFKPFVFNKEGKITVQSCLFLVLAVFVGCFGRFVASTISGILVYQTNFVESMWYQLSYIGPSSAIVLVALFLLYKPLIVINSKYKA